MVVVNLEFLQHLLSTNATGLEDTGMRLGMELLVFFLLGKWDERSNETTEGTKHIFSLQEH